MTMEVVAAVNNLHTCGQDAGGKERLLCNIFSSLLSHTVVDETSSTFLDFLCY